MASMMLKCCLFAILTGVLALLLRELQSGQWSMLCVLAGGIVLVTVAVSAFGEWLGQIRTFVEKSGLEGKEWAALLKSALVCISVDVTGEFCKNMGQPFLAHGLEMAGRVCLGVIAIPYILDVLSLLESILRA